MIAESINSLTASPTPPNNLPTQQTSFVGRENEIEQVFNLMQNQQLVTIIGWGGAGKTRLSLQVATRLLNSYPDGVWLVELAPLSESNRLEQHIATTLGLHETHEDSPLDNLISYLASKRLLLVLDNCEHLISRCAEVAQALLTACPRLQILATSREALSIPVETTWAMPPMSLPDFKDLPTTTSDSEIATCLLQYEAVQLFVERARTVHSDFQITTQNAPALLDLCQRLDGLPLAIELAAARVKTLSVQQISLRLSDAFRLLNRGDSRQLPRQQTLRALIDWSYQLLTLPESRLLQSLAIFAGGWTSEAAAVICQGEGLPQSKVGTVLQQLVNKSLVAQTETPGGLTYYRLLETIRQYALEKLETASYYEDLGRKHASYFLRLAEEAEPKLRGFEQKQWLERLELEHDNLRAALRWYTRRADRPLQDVEGGVRLASALWWFWWRRGHLVEGRRWMETAIGKSWVGQNWLPRPLLAKGTHALGGLAYHTGDYDLAKQMWEESLVLKKDLGDMQGASYTLNNLGEMAQRQGNYRQSIAFHEESLNTKRETGDRWGTAYSLNELGTIFQRQGKYEQAKALLEEALVLFEETGHGHGIARSYHNLGKAVLCLGDWPQARRLHEHSLREFEQLNEKAGVADSLDSLGLLALFQGNYEEATNLIQRSRRIFEEVGDRWGLSYALNDLGFIALARRDYAQAGRLLQESLQIKQKLNDKESIAWTLEGLALAAALQDKSIQAGYLFGATEHLRTKLGTPTPPPNQQFYDSLLPADFATTQGAKVEEAKQHGAKMSFEQVLGLALGN